MVITVTLGGETALRGYLAIDATVNGRSYGGVSMVRELSPDTIARVARTKTLKYGLLGLPVGGAKAGICADPYNMSVEGKRKTLQEFGAAIKPYLKTRSFVPTQDIGTTNEDIRHMFTANGIKVMPRSLVEAPNTTGITVYAAGINAASHLGLDVTRLSVAVEGFGSVGSAAALAFWKGGASVVAISTVRGAIYNDEGLDVGELAQLRESMGDNVVETYPRGERIQKERLAALDVDIFSPCAEPDTITTDNASFVAAKIICPGANCPTTPEAERILFERGVLSVPDFMANCGGVLGASMQRAGIKKKYVEKYIVELIGKQTAEVLAAAKRENMLPRLFAERIAEKRFEKAKVEAESSSILGQAFRIGLELYRKGIIPYQLVAPFAPWYFRRKFIQIKRQEQET